MPAPSAAIALTLLLAATATAANGCPPTNGRDAPACDVTVPNGIMAALCAAAANAAETCADQATGVVHAIYLTRAASEWRKAALASGRRTPRARRWLAHATVLDERVQDDPNAPRDLRAIAKHDEALATTALTQH